MIGVLGSGLKKVGRRTRAGPPGAVQTTRMASGSRNSLRRVIDWFVDKDGEEALYTKDEGDDTGKEVDGKTFMDLSPEALEQLGRLSRVPWKVPHLLPEEYRERFHKLFKDRPLVQMSQFYSRFHEKRTERFNQLEFGVEKVDPIRYSWRESLAYTAFDMVPSYSILRRVMNDTFAKCDPGELKSFKRVLDFGSGPGTAVMALKDCDYVPNINEAMMIEPSRSMWDISVQMIQGELDYRKESIEDIMAKVGNKEDRMNMMWSPSLPEIIQGLKAEQFPKYDVITCAFTLSELRDIDARTVGLSILWSLLAPGGVLIIVERQNKACSMVMQQARHLFVDHESVAESLQKTLKFDPFEYDGKIVAPCTHTKKCPMVFATDQNEARFQRGCSFIQSCERSITKRSGKGQGKGVAASNFQYSYVSIRKDLIPKRLKTNNVDEDQGVPVKESRIVRQPLLRSRHVIMDVCTSEGRLERLVFGKDKLKNLGRSEVYRAARKSRLGGLWFVH